MIFYVRSIEHMMGGSDRYAPCRFPRGWEAGRPPRTTRQFWELARAASDMRERAKRYRHA